MKLDAVTAWLELARFAEDAGVELDERAHPDWRPGEEGETEPSHGEGESEISDYRDLMRALQSGHMDLDEQGVLTIHWKRPPSKDKPNLKLDPNTWPYSRALSDMHKSTPPPVSAAARKRTPVQGEDRLAQLDHMLETLAGERPGLLMGLGHRHDRDLAVCLTKFIVAE